MEQIIRAKVEIFFKIEKLRNAFNRNDGHIGIQNKKVGMAVIIYH